MKGHEGIIQMRMKGQAPELVYLYDCPTTLTDWQETDMTPTVALNNELPEALDLRFLVGLRVSVSSPSEDRAKRLFNACKRAGAKWVGASHTKMVGEVAKTGWMEFHFG